MPCAFHGRDLPLMRPNRSLDSDASPAALRAVRSNAGYLGSLALDYSHLATCDGVSEQRGIPQTT